MDFSIIIPTYNRAYIIDKAINSVINQCKNHEIEIIVVDDGSTDNTSALINKINDKRIKYFYEENRGPSAARNLGLSHTSKQWIVYLDSDNELYPNYFDVLSDYLSRNKEALYIMVRATKENRLYENGKLIKSQLDKENALKSATLQDLITSKKIYFDVNGFAYSSKLIQAGIKWDENLKRLEDWEFLMQIAEYYPKNFLYIPDPIVYYHRSFGFDGIIANSSYKDWADAFEYIYQKHKGDKLLQGQTWYPRKVEEYRVYQKDFEEGKIPSHNYKKWFD